MGVERAELEVVISSQADRVLAGLASFERALERTEKAHIAAGNAADRQSVHINHLGHVMEQAAQRSEFLALGFEHFRSIMAGGAISFGLFELIHSTVAFDEQLARLTQRFQGDAEAASTWLEISKLTGVELPTIEKAISKLSVAVEGHIPALRQMGIATVDAKGNYLSLSTILLQSADYFKAHAGATDNAALAQQLFGKGGKDLLPILEKGRDALNAVTEEARKYGLILGVDAVQRNAAFAEQLKASEMAIRGLTTSLGNALLPGIAALAQGLSRIVEMNLPAFIAGINRAVSYIIGFVEGLTGTTLAVDENAQKIADLARATDGYGNEADSAANSSKAFAAAEKQIREEARDATAAIDAQIRSLEREQQQEQFGDKMAQLRQDRADKAKKVADEQAKYDAEILLGNFGAAKDVNAKLTIAKEELAKAEKAITRASTDEQRKTLIDHLKDQQKAIQEDSQKRIEAMQAAADGMTRAIVAAGPAMSSAMAASGKDMADKLKFAMDAGAEATGKSVAEKLAAQFKAGDWKNVGETVGEAVGTGIMTALGNKFKEWWEHFLRDGELDPSGRPRGGQQLNLLQLLMDSAAIAGSFAEGGYVPGIAGEPKLIKAHAGEQVLTPAQQQQRGGGGNSVSITIYGATDTAETERVVRRVLMDALGTA